jgi:hypothetical protein
VKPSADRASITGEVFFGKTLTAENYARYSALGEAPRASAARWSRVSTANSAGVRTR